MDDRTTLTIHQEFRKAGYDLEEEYFHRQNQRAILAFRRLLKKDAEPQTAPLTRSEKKKPSVWRRLIDWFFKPRRIGVGDFPI